MPIPTPEQRASKDPVMKEWVAAKDKENGTTEKTMTGPILPGTTRPTVTVPVTTDPVKTTPTSGTLAGPYLIKDANGNVTGSQQGMNVVDNKMIPNAPAATGANTTIGGSSPELLDAQSYIDKLAAAQKSAAIAGLTKSRDAALSNLNTEKAGIQPKYYAARNQVAAGGQQASRNFAEYMAARGGASAGANAQATLTNNMTTMSGVNNLNTQEVAANDDISRRTTDVNNAFEVDKASSDAGIEAEKMKNLLNDYYAAQTRGDTLAQNAILNKLQQSQQEFNQNMQTNQYNQDVKNNDFNQNMQTKQLERSNFESDRSYELAKSNQEWSQAFQNEQYSDQKAQQIWDNTFKDKNFTQSMNEAAASRGLQWASLDQRSKEFVADQTFREKSFTADQEQRVIDNKYKENQSKPASKTASDYYQELDSSMYLSPETIPGAVGQPPTKTGKLIVNNPDALEAMIFGLGLSNDEAYKLLQRYNLVK